MSDLRFDLESEGPILRLGAVLALVAGIGVFGLLRWDMITGAEYRVARVQSVQQVAGSSMHHRLVVVDLGDMQRALQTSDWMVPTAVGAPVCIKRQHLLLRRYLRHSIVLPGYCQAIRFARPVEQVGAGPLPIR